MKTITMKGQTNHDFELIIAGGSIGGSERPILANRSDEYITINGRDGTLHKSGSLGNIEIRISFIKKNHSMTQWNKDRKSIAAWLHSKGEIRIEFDDEPGLYYVGKVSSTDFPTMYSPRINFGIVITAQPFRYSDDIEAVMSFTDGQAKINNKGNYEAPYLLTLTVQTATSNVEFGIGSAILKYDASLRNGDIVTIDTDLLEFRLNGELKVLEVDGAFELLQPGLNTIHSTVTGKHVIEYQERSI